MLVRRGDQLEPVGQPQDYANIAVPDLLLDRLVQRVTEVGERLAVGRGRHLATTRHPALKQGVVPALVGKGAAGAADAAGHVGDGRALGEQLCGLMPVDDAPHRTPASARLRLLVHQDCLRVIQAGRWAKRARAWASA
jgi:hypothetical protein